MFWHSILDVASFTQHKMPIIRNPFRKQDENVRPATAIPTSNGDKFGSSRSLDLTKEKEPAEYKLSGRFMSAHGQ